MDPIRKIPKKFTKKFGNKVINRQYFCRKTGLYTFFLTLANFIWQNPLAKATTSQQSSKANSEMAFVPLSQSSIYQVL